MNKIIKNNNQKQDYDGVSKRKQHIISLFFVFIVTFGLLGFSIKNLNLSKEVKNITGSWAPKFTDLGKIKYVNLETEIDVLSQVQEMNMPFVNSHFLLSDNDGFLVNGLGGMVVKSCLNGKVVKIEEGAKKKVFINHGKSLVSVYSEIDNVGVKVGDSVEKNTPIGVSLSSIIHFQILFRNKPLTGLCVKDGELQFL